MSLKYAFGSVCRHLEILLKNDGCLPIPSLPSDGIFLVAGFESR